MSKSVQNVTSVMLDSIHEEIPEYIYRNKIMIGNYDDMKAVYLRMLGDGYLFPIDRDTLIGCLTDLTYMFCPGDDLNKDKVLELLDYDDDDDDDDGDDDDGEGGEEGEGGGEGVGEGEGEGEVSGSTPPDFPQVPPEQFLSGTESC